MTNGPSKEDNIMGIGDKLQSSFVRETDPQDVEKRKKHKLCYHGASWSPEYGNARDAHLYPCFTEDNKKIIVTSDKAGKTCLYMIDLKTYHSLNKC